MADRLGKVVDSNGNTTEYNYDIESNLESIIQKFNGSTHTTSYSYDKDNKPIEVNYDNNKITYGYDTTLGRLTNKSISTNGGTSSIYDVTYTYDSRGNIKTVTDENNKTIEYFYNYLNELERENNEVLDKTIIYSYGKGGNILSKKEYVYTISDTPATLIKEYNYQYTDANWKDKLTSFDGKAITYDLIGNPLTYDNYNFTWQKGRPLGAINGNGQNIIFKYNVNGIRTEKDVNGVKTKYLLEGDLVTYETNGTDKIHHTYTNSGYLISMNLNDEEYFYIRNTQGDIIGLIDDSGTEVVKYTYDSWGKQISIDGSNKDTLCVKNPYRYRGYRYDTETGLYYLQSRYYNPDDDDHMIGEKETKTSSETTWQNGKTERLDVENPAPGKRPGQIHYSDPSNKKWYFNIKKRNFYDKGSGMLAPRKIQKLLKNTKFQKGIDKALKFLGEPPIFK